MRRALIFVLLWFAPTLALATQLTATRLWPSPEYTRLTLEANQAIRHRHFTLTQPDRLVIDLEGLSQHSVLEGLPAQVSEQDPFIAAIRVAVNRPGVVRIVLDLKRPVRPSLFALQPLAQFGHRLVIDLYPPDAPAVPGSVAARPEPPPAQTPAPAVARTLVVAIDPGHGGEDPGAIGPAGTREKDITLAVAQKLKRRIDAEPGMRAVLTRDGDYFVPLAMRVARARAAEADLFVSIHADAFIRPHARGSSVFALSESGATSTAARWLAKRENEADLIGGVNIDVKDPFLKRTLIDLSQTATINDSLKFGRLVLRELGTVNTLHKPRVEQAGFAVLKAPDIPSILVETAFISNPEEERRLNDPAFQDRLVEALVSGIKAYFDSHPLTAPSRLSRNP